LLESYRHVVTGEEGTIAGGLGSLAAEAIAQHGLPCRLSMQGVRVPFVKEIGCTEYLRARHQLDPASLAASAEQWLRQRQAA
jgi:transketolase C-terminal domain/subunit